MKLIIEGKAYDTDKATLVTGGDNSAWSSAWWGLYRTDNGTFFKIVARWRDALADAQARANLEKHANRLVEQYFGPMPEPGAFRRDLRFSRRTIIAAIELMGAMAAANSQIRSFLDGLLDEIAVRIDPSAAAMASGQPRRTRLALGGFLSRELNEWDDSGTGFVNGLVKRLHPHGSHPGLSDQDDSTFRLHIVLLTARLLLVRFDTWGTP